MGLIYISNVYIENNTLLYNGEFDETIKDVISACLKHEGFLPDAEVDVLITESAQIQTLNKKYRGKDSVTDVLSFPMYERSELLALKSGFVVLGDIVLCYDKALEQAETYAHSVKRELAFLTAHSMLHLFGYDHMTAADEEIMCLKQEEILDSLNITRFK